MLPVNMKLERPATLGEALKILDYDYGFLQVIAGGTDVIPRLKDRLIHPKILVDLSLLKQELNYIVEETGCLRIGALTTHTEICQSRVIKEKVLVLAQACQSIGSKQIRNRGTLGGNLVNASPAGDTLPVLLALDARVKIVNCNGVREISLDQFLLGPGKTQLAKNEILSEIIIPLDPQGILGLYRKLGNRNALTIAIASVAVIKKSQKQACIAFGALGPRVFRGYELEKAWAEDPPIRWGKLKETISHTVKPISDLRASAEYRKEMAANLTYICLTELGMLQSL